MPVILPPPPPPPPASLVLDDYQIFYNGLRMGQGTKYRIRVMDGFRSMPQLRTSDYARLKHHGAFSGIDVLEGRHITATLLVRGSTLTDLDALLTALEFATVPLLTGSLPLTFKLPRLGQRIVNARVRKRDIPLEPTYNLGWAKVDLEWFCGDPRIYSDPPNSTVIANGQSTITNLGDFESKPLLVITPTDPQTPVGISNAADGTAIVFQPTSLGFIPPRLLVDLSLRTVIDGRATIHGSAANRFDLVANTSTWPSLQPGDNPIAVSGGSVQWIWRSAYI